MHLHTMQPRCRPSPPPRVPWRVHCGRSRRKGPSRRMRAHTILHLLPPRNPLRAAMAAAPEGCGDGGRRQRRRASRRTPRRTLPRPVKGLPWLAPAHTNGHTGAHRHTLPRTRLRRRPWLAAAARAPAHTLKCTQVSLRTLLRRCPQLMAPAAMVAKVVCWVRCPTAQLRRRPVGPKTTHDPALSVPLCIAPCTGENPRMPARRSPPPGRRALHAPERTRPHTSASRRKRVSTRHPPLAPERLLRPRTRSDSPPSPHTPPYTPPARRRPLVLRRTKAPRLAGRAGVCTPRGRIANPHTRERRPRRRVMVSTAPELADMQPSTRASHRTRGCTRRPQTSPPRRPQDAVAPPPPPPVNHWQRRERRRRYARSAERKVRRRVYMPLRLVSPRHRPSRGSAPVFRRTCAHSEVSRAHSPACTPPRRPSARRRPIHVPLLAAPRKSGRNAGPEARTHACTSPHPPSAPAPPIRAGVPAPADTLLHTELRFRMPMRTPPHHPSTARKAAAPNLLRSPWRRVATRRCECALTPAPARRPTAACFWSLRLVLGLQTAISAPRLETERALHCQSRRSEFSRRTPDRDEVEPPGRRRFLALFHVH